MQENLKPDLRDAIPYPRPNAYQADFKDPTQSENLSKETKGNRRFANLKYPPECVPDGPLRSIPKAISQSKEPNQRTKPKNQSKEPKQRTKT